MPLAQVIRYHSVEDSSYGTGTKGQEPLVNGNLKEFTIYSSYVESGDFGTDTGIGNYFSAQRAEKQEDGFYDTDMTFFWPVEGKLSFFAYTPDNSDVSIPDGQTSSLRITYTPNSNATDQKDFCVAEPMLNLTKENSPVGVKFAHTTTSVFFAAKYVDPDGSLGDNTLKVDRIDISGVCGCRDLVVSPKTSDYFTWEDSASSSTTTYSLSRISQQLQDEGLTTDMDNITLLNGRLYLLPQTIDNARLTIYFSFIRNVSGTETIVSQFVDEIALPADEWKAASTVTYNITISLSGMKIISVEPTEGVWINKWDECGPSTPDKKVIS